MATADELPRPHTGGILVVDDNKDVADALVSLLSVLGYPADAVYSGSRALEASASRQPALVFLDLDMPGMTGFETLERLRAQPRSKHARIVALTARSATTDERRCLAAGFDRFISKPIDTDVLCALADEAMRKYQ